jgi:adenine deaminase
MKSFWQKNSRVIVDCAMGRHPADLLIRDGVWVCVQTGELIPHTDIAMVDGRIAYVGPSAAHTIGDQTKIIEAQGRFLVPGLLDGHMHVESGMLTVTEFVRAVLPHGTTAMFIDPHEITNVLGMKGVKLMLDEALLQPNHVFVQIPSCVPSAPGFETPGSAITPEDISVAMHWEGVIGLGEMMNFPAVAAGDPFVLEEMQITHAAHKIIGGHYASLDLGLPFYGYLAGGAQDDHEGTRTEDAIQRARAGMKVMMRYGSAWHDVVEQVKAVTQHGLDTRNFLLCTDDSLSATLLYDGHMDRVLRHTIQQSLDPMLAIQMTTINTAQHFCVDSEIGQIAPGRYADVVIVRDLNDFRADLVIAKGKIVAENGSNTIEFPQVSYPEWAIDTVHLPKEVEASQFDVQAGSKTTVTANVIGVIENQAPTRHLQVKLPVIGSIVQLDPQADIAKLAVIERHHNSGRIQNGFVSGFGFDKRCAIASTIMHDAHHLIVTGTDSNLMARAVNRLAEIGGGQVVFVDDQLISEIKLPIAGLMSDLPATEVSRNVANVLDGFKKCGCNLNNPNMQLSLLALVVIPELRLSDLGLLDVKNFKFISVLENE